MMEGLPPRLSRKGKALRPDGDAERRRMDPLMLALRALHSVGSPESMCPEDLERQRKGQEWLGRLAAPTAGISWEEFSLDGMPAAWMRPQRPHRRRRVILYCHGGGYTSGNLGYSRVLSAKFAQTAGLDVLSFEYRLAPEHPYPAALLDAERAWGYLEKSGCAGADVIVAGDSAGGNLALELCARLRASGRALPGALILFSPWTDMSMSGVSCAQRADIDPMLTPEYIAAVREAYAPGADYADPKFSPLFGNFSGFPPTLIQVGTHEILFSDSERLQARMRGQGVACVLEVWEDMWHVFQMFPMKKAAAAMESVPGFLLEWL